MKTEPIDADLAALAGLLCVEPKDVPKAAAFALGTLDYAHTQLKRIIDWAEEREPSMVELIEAVEQELDREAEQAACVGNILSAVDEMLDDAKVEPCNGTTRARVHSLIAQLGTAENKRSDDAEELIPVAHKNVEENDSGDVVGDAIAFFKTQEFIARMVGLVQGACACGLNAPDRVARPMTDLLCVMNLTHAEIDEAPSRTHAALQYLATRKEPKIRAKIEWAEPRTHELKSWTTYYVTLTNGKRNFEIRRDDRGYAEGDLLRLREWRPVTEEYTGREVMRRVTYVVRNQEWLKPGYVCMGLEPVEEES